VVSGFGAMTGSPSNDSAGGPGFETLREEGGNRPHLQGVLSMLPLTERTNGSQFFITLSPVGAERLEGKQTVFGRVIGGMDVVQRLHRIEPTSRRGIVDPDRILEATVIRKRNHKYAGYSTGEIGQEKYLDGLK